MTAASISADPAEQWYRPMRVLGFARVAVGAAVFLAPRTAASLFAGPTGDGPVLLFARCFGARDALIGAGIVTGRSVRWLRTAALADAADAVAVLAGWRGLDRRRRMLALVASLTPAVVEAWVVSRMGRAD